MSVAGSGNDTVPTMRARCSARSATELPPHRRWKRTFHVLSGGVLLLAQASNVEATCGTIDSTAFAGGVGANVPCKFPFSYLGTTYQQCTTTDSSTGPWCATAGWGVDGGSDWGFCNVSCTVPTTPSTALDSTPAASITDQQTTAAGSVSSEGVIALVVGCVCLIGAIVAVIVLRRSRDTDTTSKTHTDSSVTAPDNNERVYDYASDKKFILPDVCPKVGQLNSEAMPEKHVSNLYSKAKSSNGDVEIIPVDDVEKHGNDHVYELAVAVPKTSKEESAPELQETPSPVMQPTHATPVTAPHSPTQKCVVPADIIDLMDRTVLPPMAGPVQLVSETEAGASIAAYRRVNEQARGEHAGQKTAVNADARFIVDNIRTQQTVHDANRVVGEVRGEFAGQKTNVSFDSRHIQAELGAQCEVNSYRRINEQARGELVGVKAAISSDAQFISSPTKAQEYQNKTQRVNEQLRGELVGKSNYGLEAPTLLASQAASKMNSDVHRVNDQLRGQLVGQRSFYDFHAQEITSRQVAGRLNSEVHRVNEQVRGELVGQKSAFDHNSAEMVAYRTAQARATADQRERSGMFGQVDRDKIADYRYHDGAGKDIAAVCQQRQDMSTLAKDRFEAMMMNQSTKQARKRTTLI
mmetsp:Transcript_6638/g.19679  ORF Transcript_6638/g.19679 Transcript_6638/m.19679 type:complete len:637 (-) Transcript_6638:103-2013(-)